MRDFPNKLESIVAEEDQFDRLSLQSIKSVFVTLLLAQYSFE
jgi:hypothetical protein